MLSKFKLIFFLAVLVISGALRFYQLGSVPKGLSVDEADIGYNAFSILKTGKDVYGKQYPIFFQSLDDFKPGLPVYTILFPIWSFGLSDFSVRLLPGVIGLVIPVLVFFLTKLMYKKEKYLPYFTSIFFTFAPWSISLSRAMIFYIETLLFFLLFFLFFFLAIRRNINYLFVAVIFLGLTVYAYYASFIYLPFLVLALLILYGKYLIVNFKKVSISAVLLVILLTPALIHYQNGDSRTRLNAISVLMPDVTLPLSIVQQKADKESGNAFASIIHNRRFVYLTAMLENYFDYFNFDYLFVNSKNVRYFYVNGVGLFYLIEIPLVLLGLSIVLKRRKAEDKLLLFLLLLSPIPAMITLGSPFPHRALLMFIPIQIISAIGAYSIYQKSKSRSFGKGILGVTVVLYLISIYFFVHQYFLHSPSEFSTEFDNGAWFSTVRDVIPKLNEERVKYDKVIFTWSQGKLVPPVYYLFYNSVDPTIIQKKSAKWNNESPSYKQIYNEVDNIQFRPIYWADDKYLKNTLIVAYPDEILEATPASLYTSGTKDGVHFVFHQNP